MAGSFGGEESEEWLSVSDSGSKRKALRCRQDIQKQKIEKERKLGLECTSVLEE